MELLVCASFPEPLSRDILSETRALYQRASCKKNVKAGIPVNQPGSSVTTFNVHTDAPGTTGECSDHGAFFLLHVFFQR